MRVAALLALCLVLAAGLWGAAPADRFPEADAGLTASAGELARWHTAVNLSHNAYHSWRADPVLINLESALAGGGPSPRSHWMVCLSVFFLGFTLWLNHFAGGGRLPGGAAASLLFVLIAVFLWGQDSVVIGALTWLPWLALSACLAVEPGGPVSLRLAALLIFSCLNALSANQWAMITAAGARLCSAGEGDYPKRRGAVTGLMMFLPALLVLALSPRPDFPDYPVLAHVVSHMGVSGIPRASAGPDQFPINVIDQGYLKSAYAGFAAVLFFFAALIALWPRTAFRRKHLLWLSAAAAGLAALDTCLPESLSYVMPLAAVNRIVPGFFELALLPVISAGALFFFFSFAAANQRPLLLLALAAALSAAPYHNGGFFGAFAAKPGLFQKTGGRRAWLEYQREFAGGKDRSQTAEDYKRVLLSPSYGLINSYGLWILRDRALFGGERFQALEPGAVIFSDYGGHHGEDLLKLVPAARGLRWSAGDVRQRGGEWLHLYFKQSVRLRGVELPTGDNATDFPRGLRILAKEGCAIENGEGPDAGSGYREIINLPVWEGEVLFTPSGYPYYGAQSAVRVVFPAAVKAQCLLIRQTGRWDHFDWSVTAVRIMAEG